ncbi:MAG TPA: TonB family protein [Blastocatellia bacterium]|nr:TonB family protein [Blastocatellia bacterium]
MKNTLKRGRSLLGLGIVGGTLLCSGPSVTAQSQQETAEQFVDRVKKAIKNDEWGRAQSGIKHALALKPESAEANFIAAQVYWHEGARSQAIEALNKALGLQPVFPDARLLLAKCLRDANRLDDARMEANMAIGQGASLFTAYRLLAEIDITKGDFDAAIVSLETALRLSSEPDPAEATRLRDEIDNSRELIEKLRKFADIEASQKKIDIVRPLQLNGGQPRYTEEARKLRIQGPVFLAILITENGDVDSVLLFRGLGHGLDEQAMEVARNLKFAPATRNGQSIPYWMKLIIKFNLI